MLIYVLQITNDSFNIWGNCNDYKDKVNNLRRGLRAKFFFLCIFIYIYIYLFIREFYRDQVNRRNRRVENQQVKSFHLGSDRILNSTWIQSRNKAVKNEVKYSMSVEKTLQIDRLLPFYYFQQYFQRKARKDNC